MHIEHQSMRVIAYVIYFMSVSGSPLEPSKTAHFEVKRNEGDRYKLTTGSSSDVNFTSIPVMSSQNAKYSLNRSSVISTGVFSHFHKPSKTLYHECNYKNWNNYGSGTYRNPSASYRSVEDTISVMSRTSLKSKLLALNPTKVLSNSVWYNSFNVSTRTTQTESISENKTYLSLTTSERTVINTQPSQTSKYRSNKIVMSETSLPYVIPKFAYNTASNNASGLNSNNKPIMEIIQSLDHSSVPLLGSHIEPSYIFDRTSVLTSDAVSSPFTVNSLSESSFGKSLPTYVLSTKSILSNTGGNMFNSDKFYALHFQSQPTSLHISYSIMTSTSISGSSIDTAQIDSQKNSLSFQAALINPSPTTVLHTPIHSSYRSLTPSGQDQFSKISTWNSVKSNLRLTTNPVVGSFVSLFHNNVQSSIVSPVSYPMGFSVHSVPNTVHMEFSNVFKTSAVETMSFPTSGFTTVVTPPSTNSVSSTSVPSASKEAVAGSTPATGIICTNMDSYFPKYIEMEESDAVGTVLASMPTVSSSHNVTFEVEVTEPVQLTHLMKGYFGVHVSDLEFTLTLLKFVDVEQLYHLTGKTVPVKDIQIEIECTESFKNAIVKERIAINMTIWDEDDELPRFQNQDGGADCVIPVYKADASEDYMGELTVKPGKIEAVDGDLFIQHNISYAVMHAEPENYDVYFYLNTLDGTVNKTKTMNASDPRKYVLFIQAIEDSPQQKKKVAVLSIEVFAPSDPLLDDRPSVDPTVQLSLKVASALVLLGFATGLVVIIHHRWRRRKGEISPDKNDPCEIAREVKLPVLAVYRSSVSSLECDPDDTAKPDQSEIPSISSPSQVQVVPSPNQMGKKKRKVIVKKPIDTKLRPGWNAPTPKKKRIVYSPYKSVNQK